MATRSRLSKINLDVDERTEQMSDEALVCRSRGHKWGDRGLTRKRYQQLIKDGLWEDALYCENGCGYTKSIVWELRSGNIISQTQAYPSDGSYLLAKGFTGRIRRDSARVARVSRQISAYV
jgi:hypothetical protein